MKRVTPAALQQPEEPARLMAHRPTRVAAPAVTSIEQRLAIEHGTTQALAESNSVAEAAPRIIRTVCETLSWACGSRWAFDEERGTLACAESWGLPSPKVQAFLAETRRILQSRRPGGLVRRAWQDNEPVWIPDVTKEASFRRAPAALAADLHSAFAFPINAGGETISVMEFFSREIHRPDSELLDCTAYISSQIGQFMRRKKAEEDLGRFRLAVDLSADAIYLIDRETLRYIDVNETACRTSGYSRAELLTKGPMDLVALTREEVELAFDDLIAKSPASMTAEVVGRSKSGGESIVELQRRALKVGGRWMIVTISRDITLRKNAERVRLRLQNMFAALGATNEAIIHSRSPEELYQRVCDAAVQGGKLVTAAVMIPDPATGWAKAAAVSGGGERRLRDAPISVDAATAEGRGLVGTAYRTRQPCVINDFLNDERTQIWRAAAEKGGIKSGAAIPLVRNESTQGVLLLYSETKNAFDEEIVRLLQRMADNVAFALENFTRESERRASEAALRASEEKHRATLESIDEAYYEVDLKGSLVFLNSAYCRMLGYAESELLGMNNRAYHSEETAKKVYKIYNEVYRTGVPRSSFDFEITRKDGSLLVGDGSVYLIRDVDGKPVGFRGVLRDVTERRKFERALSESEERFRSLTEMSTDFFWETDCEHRLTKNVNKSNYVTALQRGSSLGKTRWELPSTKPGASGWRAHKETMDAHLPFRDFELARPDTEGNEQYLSISGEPRFAPDGAFVGYRGVGCNITSRIKGEAALRESEARFRSLIALSSDWYWEQDEQYRLTFMSTTVQEKTGLDPSSYLGRKRWDEAALNLTEADWENHRAQLDRREPFRDFEMQRIGRDGNPVWLSLSGEPVFDEGGIFKGYRGVGSDITARKSSEDRIQYLATHDGLTGLPNRLMFGQLLSLELESARRYERGFAVLFIDLDRFKAVNDTLGHAFGDALLKEMAARLKEALRASDVVARLGGDEFVVLVQEVNDANQVAAVARKIMSALVRPIELSGQECRVTASIGICVYPGDARDEESLMKNADMAMYLAKEAGKNNYQFYSQEIQARSIEKLAMETQLRRGLERNELSISYQAKLDLRSDAITGVEALLRWTNPELGAVSPLRFIPVAEETGLIMPIGKWVLRTACAQNVAWQKQGLAPVRMAVNLSPRQFTDPDLLDDIDAALRETGMAPELLELEITESMVMHDTARTIALLRAIKALGVRLAIDDFGTGYSSLAQLKRFPIDIIKIDRSFIRDIPADAEDVAITQAIIAMGRSLGLAVVAEGVETREQQAFLRRNGCEEMQGYFFSKPVSPEAFAELLQRHVPAI